LHIVQSITTKDDVAEERIGGYAFVVDAVPGLLTATIFLPVSFERLDAFKQGASQ